MAIRIAVVGLGPRGQEWVRNVRASPAFELVACVDIDGVALQRASQSLEVPPRRCFVDLDTALNESAATAIVVANPAESHFQTCERA
jgi:predicted dehydrogenase